MFHLYCFIVFLSKDFAESIEEDDNEAHMKIVYLNDSKAVFISSKKVENKKDKDAPPQRFTNVDVKTCYKANDSKVKGISEDQVNFRLGEFWKFTHRIPYFMKNFDSFYKRFHAHHAKLKFNSCTFCSALTSTTGPDGPITMTPIPLFRKCQSTIVKPSISKSPSLPSKGGNGGEDKDKEEDEERLYNSQVDIDKQSVAGYTAQEILDAIWPCILNFLNSGLLGTTILYLQGIALLQNPDNIEKNPNIRKQFAKPKLPTLHEEVEQGTTGESGPLPKNTTKIKIDSNRPLNIEVQQGETSRNISLPVKKRKTNAHVKSFILAEAEEGGKKQRKMPTNGLNSQGQDDDYDECYESDDEHSYDKNCDDEGNDSDDSGLGMMIDDRVIDCNNQYEAMAMTKRLQSTKSNPSFYNNSNAKRNMDNAVKSILKKRNGKAKGERGSCGIPLINEGLTDSQTGILTEKSSNSLDEALSEARQNAARAFNLGLTSGQENQENDEGIIFESDSDMDEQLAKGQRKRDIDMRKTSPQFYHDNDYIEPSQSID